MTINVSEALDVDTAEKIIVERRTGGFVNGVYIKNAPTIFTALASVQQPTPQQLQILSEGERDSNPRLFICTKVLRTTNDKDGTIADIVIYKNIRYKIINIGDWSSYGHTMAFGVRDE